jgi:hypothetical protein
MSIIKRLFMVAAAALFAAAPVAGQTSRERSVEESYLQESVETMVIREYSRADSMDQKLVALQYVGEAIGRGNTGEDVRQTLEYLATEGTLNQTREGGRLLNNYPEIRREAARYLGEMGTPEAKDTLLKICLVELEPMVLQEAIKSLGDIGLNDNEETVGYIFWVVSRFDMLKPDNMLALSAIDAFSKIAKKNNGIKDPNALRILIRISNGSYVPDVRNRAKQVLTELTKYTSQKN